tara:strand:- start:2243 stop:2701 length:459 start_codon:yes stop_codon:yes gene_type:complete
LHLPNQVLNISVLIVRTGEPIERETRSVIEAMRAIESEPPDMLGASRLRIVTDAATSDFAAILRTGGGKGEPTMNRSVNIVIHPLEKGVALRDSNIATESAAGTTMDHAVKTSGLVNPYDLVRLRIPRATLPCGLVDEGKGSVRGEGESVHA